MTKSSGDQTGEARPAIQFELNPLRLMAAKSVAGNAFLEVVQPPAPSYMELVEELVAIANRANDDPLEGYRDAIQAVVDYLQTDAATANSGALNPLFRTVGALRDVLGGSHPSVLFRSRAPETGGRPTDTHEQRINAILALAFSLMAEAGIMKKEAVAELTRSVKKHGLVNARTKHTYTSKNLASLRKKLDTGYGPVKMHQHHAALLATFDLELSDPRGSKTYALRAADHLVEAAAKHVLDT